MVIGWSFVTPQSVATARGSGFAPRWLYEIQFEAGEASPATMELKGVQGRCKMTNFNSDRLDSIDDRLARLVAVGEQQQQNIAALVTGISELKDGLSELKEIAHQQAQTAASQQETLRQFAAAFAQQARTISDLSRSVRDTVESSRSAARAAESAAVMARDNQNAIRDLIEELRQGR